MSDRTSFYGGPNGQSFEIKKIFANKVEMLADLQMRWQSSIGVSDFVVISYGIPGKQEDIFLANQNVDIARFDQSYNSTLWQKIYTENDRKEIESLRGIETYYISGNYGLGYKLIACMSGNTPRFTFYTKVIHSYEQPYWRSFTAPDATYPETASAGIDRPVLIAFLPLAQVVDINYVSLNAEDDPVFYWDTTTNNYATPSAAMWDKPSGDVDRSSCGAIKSSYDSNHDAIEDGRDRPILWLGIPPGWIWDLDYDTIAADQEPEVELTDDGNMQTLKIRLPRTWKWVLDHTILNAEDDPIVQLFTDASTDKKTLQIDIPRPWSWELDFDTLKADENPVVDLNDDGNTQTLTVKLPRTWKWILDHTILNAEDDPVVDLTADPTTDTQTLKIDVPRPWSWELDYSVDDADQDPTMDLNDDGNVQTLTVTLPRPWDWQLTGSDPITHLYTILDANETPEVILTDDGNIQYLEFKLPQSQVMDDPDTNPVAPLKNPKVTLDDSDINKPKLIFDLPRAVRFYYGGLFGERTAGTYTSSAAEVANYEPGDYYVNQSTGFIYLITDNTAGTITVQYVACIQAPLPTIQTTPVDPYTTGGAAKVDPSVDSTFDNPTELTGWKLNFNLPKLPDFSVTHEFVGAGEDGDVTLTPDDVDNVNFHLTLPQGSRMFAGLEVNGTGTNDVLSATVTTDPIVGDPLPGDLYLNTDTGKVYKLDRTGVWKYQNEGLKGPVGDALNIVREYTLTIDRTAGYVDNLQNGVDYIRTHYLEADNVTPKPYAPDEIFAITWIDPDDDDRETAYWYFYTEDNKWGRVQITGGVLNLIENEWVDSPEDNPITNKTYSIDYINKLIGGNITPENADITTFSKDQIYALFGWGTFAEAENGQWWPDIPVDHNTLSAEEIISLLSWGNFASLVTIP